ncbi:MAG TPA: uracil phosphoribosyltransferase [Acidimicrobiia bacterium]|jgi:uracil phosphoribosyltransferase|nr:uracil phosphoribosyltransferase [Acidimicrobiia bacterium]
MADNVTVLDHPLIQHKLTLMRRKETASADFRRLLREIAGLMTYEATRDLPVETERIETPLAEMDAPVIEGKKLVAISILRAGNGLLDGILDLVPSARVGHIGLYRDPDTLEAVEYYFKLPDEMEDRDVLVVDPMLATGHSSAAALDRIKEVGPRSIRLLCLLAAPEGIEYLAQHHPDVHIITAAVDSHLNDHGYIVPGLGDAGDRLFGTK